MEKSYVKAVKNKTLKLWKIQKAMLKKQPLQKAHGEETNNVL